MTWIGTATMVLFSGNLRDIRVFWYYPSAPEARVQEFPWVESGDTCSLGNGLLIFRILKFTLKIFPLRILNLVGQGFLALLVCVLGSPRCYDCSPPPPACSFLVNSLRIKPPFIAFRS